MVWDMAGGVVLVQEAGGVVLRSVGHLPKPSDEEGLYVFAPSEAAAKEWTQSLGLSQLTLHSRWKL